MKKLLMLGLPLLLNLSFSFVAYADSKSNPAGLWRTNRSILKVYSKGNELYAQVVKVLTKKGDDAICTQCKGQNKNKRLVGMKIIWGLKPEGNNEWTGGTGLDPDTGNTYQCSLKLSEDGQHIEFHASRFVFSRTAAWQRVAR